MDVKQYRFDLSNQDEPDHLQPILSVLNGPAVSLGGARTVGDDERAGGSLRSAGWRVRGTGVQVIETDRSSLTLREDVAVDVRLAHDWSWEHAG